MTVSVLFVCLGNICRSPTAEGIFQHYVNQAGLQKKIIIDSAGTGEWHIGKAPDPRTQAAALTRGYDLGKLRARQVARNDFTKFDYILAMDKQNLTDLKDLCTTKFSGQLDLFLRFGTTKVLEVPDPYYGGEKGFHQVVDLVEDAATGLLKHICKEHQISR